MVWRSALVSLFASMLSTSPRNWMERESMISGTNVSSCLLSQRMIAMRLSPEGLERQHATHSPSFGREMSNSSAMAVMLIKPLLLAMTLRTRCMISVVMGFFGSGMDARGRVSLGAGGVTGLRAFMVEVFAHTCPPWRCATMGLSASRELDGRSRNEAVFQLSRFSVDVSADAEDIMCECEFIRVE